MTIPPFNYKRSRIIIMATWEEHRDIGSSEQHPEILCHHLTSPLEGRKYLDCVESQEVTN